MKHTVEGSNDVRKASLASHTNLYIQNAKHKYSRAYRYIYSAQLNTVFYVIELWEQQQQIIIQLSSILIYFHANSTAQGPITK
jgi:hypothetical protein